MKKYSFLTAFFTVFLSFSQSYIGTLETLKQDGLYSLILTPEIRSAANENSDYIRIKDAKNNEVPYVLMYPKDKTFSNFQPLKVISKNTIKDSISSIVIENETRKNNDNLTLLIANTSISKKYTIYGSNDQKKWFGLVENRNLVRLSSTNETFVEKTISYPLNAYQFLRINFEDKKSLPINILKVGVYKNKFFIQEPIELNNYKQEITFVKERKVTKLKFTSETLNKIHVISFKINTEFYLREAKVIVKRTRKLKRRAETYDEVIGEFQLNSKNENTFVLDDLNEKEFWIEIENKDNPSLDIEKVRVYQKPIYLVANLKQKEKYNFIIDGNLRKPSYDLGNFISDKTNIIDEVGIQGFSINQIESDTDTKGDYSLWNTPLFMWICIVVGGAIVLYFTKGLLKDLNNQERK